MPTSPQLRNGRSRYQSSSSRKRNALPDIAVGEIPWGTLLGRKLTKNLLRLLPEGVYVTSNLFSGGEEIFSERLGSLEICETAWRRATLAGANDRLRRLLWTEDDFNGLSLASHVQKAHR